MLRRPPGYTRSDTLSPYPTLFQSAGGMAYTISTLLDGGLLHRDLMTVSTGDLTEYAREPMLDGDALAWADAPANSLDETMLRSYDAPFLPDGGMRSEEHTSELQSLMRISYAVFCLKKKTSL